jgi:hypothetical protein
LPQVLMPVPNLMGVAKAAAQVAAEMTVTMLAE